MSRQAGMSSSSCSRSAEECSRWMQRVHEVQSQRTPEALEAARERIERSRQAEVSYRKCKAVKGHAVRSRALAAEGLRQMSSSSGPQEFEAVHARWKAAQELSRSRQVQALSRAEEAVSVDCFMAGAALLEDAEDEEGEAMEEAAQLVGAADSRSLAAFGEEGLDELPWDRGGLSGSGSKASSSSTPAARAATAPSGVGGAVDGLLAQLRKEPKDNAECAVKFGLYEGYSKEVEQVRDSLLKFHEESRSTVPEVVARDMDKQVEAVDSLEAMAIPESRREWFVYHMMRKAERNNLKMASVLGCFEKRLEFLAVNDQSECPVCLEPFADGGLHAAETLGCCHKVCADCWEIWSAVMFGRPFCPLCRHDEFLGTVAAQVPVRPAAPRRVIMSI